MTKGLKLVFLKNSLKTYSSKAGIPVLLETLTLVNLPFSLASTLNVIVLLLPFKSVFLKLNSGYSAYSGTLDTLNSTGWVKRIGKFSILSFGYFANIFAFLQTKNI